MNNNDIGGFEMKTKILFIVIVGLVLFGVLFMNYGQTVSIDCIGAAIVLAGGGLAVYDSVKAKRKAALIPLAVGLITLIITGFIQFNGVIVVAAFGFIALGIYLYLRFHNQKNN
ncbi:hypothetical protein HMPREF9554_00221 [Treponema phagedenis F0421]|nr:hypothetical protein HMPREF9554_00221 [Treponema phagedenis F0421]